MPEGESIFSTLGIFWKDGGVLMWPLTAMAILIYTESFRVFFKVLAHPISSIQSRTVQLNPRQLDWLAKAASQEHHRDFDQDLLFQTRKSLMEYFQRRIQWLSRFLKCCPLLGLLGTVIGMESTFKSLQETGLSQSEGMASGISEALITTQYGLMIAIPGLFMLIFLKARLSKIDQNFLKLGLTSFRSVIPKSSHLSSPPLGTEG